MRTIGESMRIARRSRGLSVRELSEQAGVSKTTFFHIEEGIAYPSLITLCACADVLGGGIDEYIGRETSKERR